MKSFGRVNQGFSLLEVLAVIAIIGILAAMLLPGLAKGHARAKQIQCVNQLRQAGMAFHLFAHDHGGQFPMQVSTNQGGTLEFVQAGQALGEYFFAFRHFQVLSNELQTPRVLVCPADTRTAADNFSALKNENLSYFVAPTAEYKNPLSILAGDRNITNSHGQTRARMGSGFNDPIGWTHELHQFRGNLLFADSHVEQVTSAGLMVALKPSPPTANLVHPPVIPSAAVTRPQSNAGTKATPNAFEQALNEAAKAARAETAEESKPSPAPPTIVVGAPPDIRPATVQSPPDELIVPVVATPPVVESTNAPAPAIPASAPEAKPAETAFPEWIIATAQNLVRTARDATYWLLILLLLALIIFRTAIWWRMRRKETE